MVLNKVMGGYQNESFLFLFVPVVLEKQFLVYIFHIALLSTKSFSVTMYCFPQVFY